MIPRETDPYNSSFRIWPLNGFRPQMETSIIIPMETNPTTKVCEYDLWVTADPQNVYLHDSTGT